MYAYMLHMTKVISISDTAYERLASLKRGKESFSDVVIRLTEKEKKKSLLEYAGSWKGSYEEAERIKKELREERDASYFKDYKL